MTAGHLNIMRGYPASGKTTLAREWVAVNPARRVRLNRDDLRRMTYGADRLNYDQEQLITATQHAAARALLSKGKGVVVDDTNLKLRNARAWVDLALEVGATWSVIDVTTDLETCILRDRDRQIAGERFVGADAIAMLADRFPLSRWPEVLPTPEPTTPRWEPYMAPKTGAEVWIVDIDGTVAKKLVGEGSRGWYDYFRVGEDLPNQAVIDMVKTLHHAGDTIIFMSGRKDYCRETTRAWLAQHVGQWTRDSDLFMRGDDDNRSDDIVKYELFNESVRDYYRVLGVLDDRDRVVAMWRAIGLQVYQVAPGAF